MNYIINIIFILATSSEYFLAISKGRNEILGID